MNETTTLETIERVDTIAGWCATYLSDCGHALECLGKELTDPAQFDFREAGRKVDALVAQLQLIRQLAKLL